MPEKPWAEMSVDEKLEWLRAETQRLIGVGNFNNNSLNERERTINQRLAALEEHVSKTLDEARKDKPPSSL